MKQEKQSQNSINNHLLLNQPSVFDPPQHAQQAQNINLLTPTYLHQKGDLQVQNFNVLAAQTSSQLSMNQNNNGSAIQPSFGALSFAGQEQVSGQLAISSYTQDIRLLKQKSGAKIGIVNNTSMFVGGSIAGQHFDNHLKIAQEPKTNQNFKALQQSTMQQNINQMIQNQAIQSQNGLNLQKNPSFPCQSQNKLIDSSRLQIAATLSQQQPVARVMALENFQQQQNLNESTIMPQNQHLFPQNPYSSTCSNSTQIALTHNIQSYNVGNVQEIISSDNQQNYNNFQNSQISSSHTQQFNLHNDQNCYSIASQNNKENIDFQNVVNNIQNNPNLQQQLSNNTKNLNRNKIFQIVNSAQNLVNKQQNQKNEIEKTGKTFQKQNHQCQNNSNSSMSAYSNGRMNNNINVQNDNIDKQQQINILNEQRQAQNVISQVLSSQNVLQNSNINNNLQQEQQNAILKQQSNQQMQKTFSSGNHHNPFQQNNIKNQIKSIHSNSTSINLPRGTNPKRSFGRESENQTQLSNNIQNQNLGQNPNIFGGSILMKGAQNKQIGINSLNNGINRFQIHPILQGGHNQIVGLGIPAKTVGLQTQLSSVQQQARTKNQGLKNNDSGNQMMIVENQIKIQKQEERMNQSNEKQQQLDNFCQGSNFGGVKNMESKYKVMNYDYNSSNNLHFKAQRNQSLLSGINYPKKNINNNIPSRRDDSYNQTFVVNGQHNQNTASSVESSSANSKQFGFQHNNQSSQSNGIMNQQNKDFLNTTQMPQIIKPQNLHQHSTSTQHQTIIQQQLISAPQIIGNTSKPQAQLSSELGNKGINGGSISSLTTQTINSLKQNNQPIENAKFQKNSSVVSAMSGIEMRNGAGSNSQGPPGVNKSGKINQNPQTSNQTLIIGSDSVKQNKSLNLKNVKQMVEQKQHIDSLKSTKSNYLQAEEYKQKSEDKLHPKGAFYYNQQDQIQGKNQSNIDLQNQPIGVQIPSTIKIQESIEKSLNEIHQANSCNQNQLGINSSQENISQQFKQFKNSQASSKIHQNQTHRNFGQPRYSVLTSNNPQSNLLQVQQQNQDGSALLPANQSIYKHKNSSMDRSQTNKNVKAVFNNNQLEKQKLIEQQQQNNLQQAKKYFTNNLPLLQNSQNNLPYQNANSQKDSCQQNQNMKKRINSHIPIVSQQANQTSQHARNKSHNTSSQNTANVSAAKDQHEMQKRLMNRAQGGQDQIKLQQIQKQQFTEIQNANGPQIFETKLNQINQTFNQRVTQYLRNEIEDCDSEYAGNPQSVAEFTRSIMQHYMNTEQINQPKMKYMELQRFINERMRSILIDWIIEVHYQFKLKTQSLFLTVNLIDRYLEKAQVSKENLQLVGVSAMLIACKYEEIWPPLIKDYIYMCDNAYDKEQIINMELSMLSELDFNLDFVSANSFLERFVQVTKADQMTHHLAQYMIEISMLDYSSIHIQPSYMAMSALYLAQKIIKNPNPFSQELKQYTQYSEKNVENLSQVLFRLLKNYQKPNQLMGLKKKFSSEQFSCISQQIQFENSYLAKNSCSGAQHGSAGEEGGISNNKSSSRGKSNVKTQASYMNGGSTSEGKRTISAEKMGQFTTQKSVGSTLHGTSNKKANTFQFNQKKKIQVNTPALQENQIIDSQNINKGSQKQNGKTTLDSSTQNFQKESQNIHQKQPSVSQFLRSNTESNSVSKNGQNEFQKMQSQQLLAKQQYESIQKQIEMQKMLNQGNFKFENLSNDEQQMIIEQMQKQKIKHESTIGNKIELKNINERDQYSSSRYEDHDQSKSSFSSENTYSSGECDNNIQNNQQAQSSLQTNTMDHDME